MAQDELILVAIEEMAKQLTELNKNFKTNPTSGIDFKPLIQKIENFEKHLTEIKDHNTKNSYDINMISERIGQISTILASKQNEVLHRFIEVKKPIIWIISVIGYFIITFFIIIGLIKYNQNLRTEIDRMKPNDFKYRFLKLNNDSFDEIKKVASNTAELTYFIDSYYNKKSQNIQEYVIKRENEIQKAFEASEIAKQKEAEAKEAKEHAIRLKEKIDTNNK